MQKVSLILTFLLTTLLCFGQKDHLEPPKVRDLKDKHYEKFKEYSDKFNALLYKGFPQKPYACYVCHPSFTATYAFSVEKSEGECYVISNKFSTSYTEIVNYWMAEFNGGEDTVKIETSKIKINNDLYLKIGELFELLAVQTKEKEKERKFVVTAKGEVEEIFSIKLDGTIISNQLTKTEK